MELEDKTIIITGASSGIGKAAAILLAREGCSVPVVSSLDLYDWQPHDC